MTLPPLPLHWWFLSTFSLELLSPFPFHEGRMLNDNIIQANNRMFLIMGPSILKVGYGF
jgi:hypothetical protein